MPYKVAVIVGSLRKDSINRKAAHALAQLAPESLQLEIVEIGDLPLYDEDLETADAPAAWTRFRAEVAAADAVLFVTPEYNRSIPGGLKNAIDVGSRPWGKAVWNGKPAAIMTVSPGALGGFGANHHLRQAISFFDMPVLGQPEAYVGSGHTLFGEDGAISNDASREFFGKFINAFAGLIGKVLG
ncbi:MAG: NAD(P)H-dependent oxidoreductase [Sphingomonadales bacterium]|nr:NAD(P)H-dependent oxidoreductase [Sphingomonadales bacterium]